MPSPPIDMPSILRTVKMALTIDACIFTTASREISAILRKMKRFNNRLNQSFVIGNERWVVGGGGGGLGVGDGGGLGVGGGGVVGGGGGLGVGGWVVVVVLLLMWTNFISSMDN